MRRCGETGKISFDSPAAAQHELRRIQRVSKTPPSRVYRCPFEAHWHLTSQEDNVTSKSSRRRKR